jgi:thiamine kinase-like enzyme
MRAAAAAGLAPKVVTVDAGAGILLTDYRKAARAWTATDARQPRNIARAAALLRALHAVRVDSPVFASERIARGYLAALERASGGVGSALGSNAPGQRPTLDARDRRWAEELLTLARHYDAAYPPTALCHNDLVAANVLDDGSLVLVDFEYAVRGAPVLDLAGLAGMNDYGAREHRELLAAYRGDDDRVAIAEPELARIVRLVRLMAFFWARLGELRAGESSSYRALATELVERLK